MAAIKKITHPTIRINKGCSYFPCHKILEDCTFCYCPFYPCLDLSRGKFIKCPEGKIWSCQMCNWIHKRKIVDKIFALIRKQIRPIKK